MKCSGSLHIVTYYNTPPFLLLCAANRESPTTVCAVQRVDYARDEAQAANEVPIVRTGNPTAPIRSYVDQRTEDIVAVTARRKPKENPLFIRFGIEIPSLIEITFNI